MKNIFKLLLIVLLVLPAFAQKYKIAIFDYDSRNKDEITTAKYIENKLIISELEFKYIDHYSANGDELQALKMLHEIESLNYDLIITITSDAMIPAMHIIEKTPWLFTNINNPTFFGIKDINNPGHNRSGVTYYVPVRKQLDFFNKIMNNKLKKIGIIFDDSAKSRQAEVREFRIASKQLGIKYEIELITSKDELPEAAKNLLEKNVDAIILTSSDKLYKNTNMIIEMSIKYKTPIFSVNKKAVEQGAIAALASDYFVMVEESLIPMVRSVLKDKESPGELAIKSVKNPFIYLNLINANKLNLKISTDLINKASTVYTEEKISISNGEWPPFFSKDLKHFGVTSHIVKEAFSLEDITVEYKWYPWKRAYHLARIGKINAAIGWGKTEKREKDFLFSESILEGNVVFFHLKDYKFDWNNLKDITNMKIGSITGYKYDNKMNELKKNKNISIHEVINEIKLFQLLLKGRIDIAVINIDAGYGILNKYFLKNEIKQITYNKKVFFQEHLRVLFNKKDSKNKRLLKLFNKGLNQLKGSGKFEQYYKNSREGLYELE